MSAVPTDQPTQRTEQTPVNDDSIARQSDQKSLFAASMSKLCRAEKPIFAAIALMVAWKAYQNTNRTEEGPEMGAVSHTDRSTVTSFTRDADGGLTITDSQLPDYTSHFEGREPQAVPFYNAGAQVSEELEGSFPPALSYTSQQSIDRSAEGPSQSAGLISLMKSFEGYDCSTYRCVANKETIGIGHTGPIPPGMTVWFDQPKTIVLDNQQVIKGVAGERVLASAETPISVQDGMSISPATAEALLAHDMKWARAAAQKCAAQLTALGAEPFSEMQMTAIESLAFNQGNASPFKKNGDLFNWSRAIVERDWQKFAVEYADISKVRDPQTGVRNYSKGLIMRRLTEVAVFMGDQGYANQKMQPAEYEALKQPILGEGQVKTFAELKAVTDAFLKSLHSGTRE